MKPDRQCTLANGFETWEKSYAQVSFVAIVVVGTAGVALVDWRWALVYAFVFSYGILGVVMKHLVCPRCPHLYDYGDCLQAPVWLTRRLAGERKTVPMSTVEKTLFFAYFFFVPVFPVYWLLQSPFLLIMFLVAVGAWYGGQFLRFCKRCRVHDCPFNRAKLAS